MDSCLLDSRCWAFEYADGDLRASRALADEWLAADGPSPDSLLEARMLLTAICLQMSANPAAPKTITDAEQLAFGLMASKPWAWPLFAASAMPFLHYVAEEFAGAIDPSVGEVVLRALQTAKARYR